MDLKHQYVRRSILASACLSKLMRGGMIDSSGVGCGVRYHLGDVSRHIESTVRGPAREPVLVVDGHGDDDLSKTNSTK